MAKLASPKPPKRSTVHITTHEDGTATVIIDGKDVSSRVSYFNVQGDSIPPRQVLVLEYACFEQMTITGEYEVVHVCPRSAR